mmetsp:Transcript_6620/g.22663  ORF Transcript_6620/g.22663 Transcript_6620/m.22663 type:complete len:247 (+) Transcript_6620:328-1068(+)
MRPIKAVRAVSQRSSGRSAAHVHASLLLVVLDVLARLAVHQRLVRERADDDDDQGDEDVERPAEHAPAERVAAVRVARLVHPADHLHERHEGHDDEAHHARPGGRDAHVLGAEQVDAHVLELVPGRQRWEGPGHGEHLEDAHQWEHEVVVLVHDVEVVETAAAGVAKAHEGHGEDNTHGHVLAAHVGLEVVHDDGREALHERKSRVEAEAEDHEEEHDAEELLEAESAREEGEGVGEDSEGEADPS